jgi:Family of unknown function (DUF6262)
MPADPAHRLAQHARQRHERTIQRAHEELATLADSGDPITIARLATQAGVSRSWIYTQPELRERIEQLQKAAPGGRGVDSAHRASDESLRRRLNLAHQQITQLRNENQQLRDALARAHGQLRAQAIPNHDSRRRTQEQTSARS